MVSETSRHIGRSLSFAQTKVSISRYEIFELPFLPNNFWDDINNQKEYMNWLFKKLEYKELSDWYQISTDLIRDNKGSGLLPKYDNSLQVLIKLIYPEYEWIPWKFNRVVGGYFDDINNQREYMNWLFKKLEYKEMSDWYKITQKIFGDWLKIASVAINGCPTTYGIFLHTVVYILLVRYSMDLDLF
jgi:hypothetical protein